MRIIETGRLRLEPQTVEHADEMFTVLSDPAIYTYENEPPPSLDWLRDRYRRLETRRSSDGTQQWLNWVIRLSSNGLIGYVQATVMPEGRAAVAYELSSAYWGRGLASEAVGAMVSELVDRYEVQHLSAVLKSRNARSLRLLERLGFAPAPLAAHERDEVEHDELLMHRSMPLTGRSTAKENSCPP